MTATQVLVNSGESLRVTFTVDGVATDPDGNAATVTITKDSDGTAIVTNTPATRISAGTYAYSLAPLTQLDRLTAVWHGTFGGIVQQVITYVDIVGGYYVSLAELRSMKNLGDTTKFTVAELIDARQWFETKFERYTGRCMVPRYRRLTAWGSGTDTMILPNWDLRALRAVTFGDVNLSAGALANIALEASGRIQHYWPLGVNGPDDSFSVYGSTFPLRARINVAYEHGLDSCPDDVTEAAKLAIRRKLLEDQSGPQEYAVVTDAGIVRYSRPGKDRPFGYEPVDEVANAWRRDDWNRMTVGSVPIG